MERERERERKARARAADPDGTLYWARFHEALAHSAENEKEKERQMPVENATYQISNGTFEVFPADQYECKVRDINRKTLPVTNDEGITEQGDFLEFEFQIVGGEFDGKAFTDVAREYAKWGPKSKIRAWVEGILGYSLADRVEPVDPNKIIGRQCRVTISRGLNKRQMECNKVVTILPPRKANPAPVAPPPPVAQDDLF